MKIRVYDRYDKDIPHGADIYIIDSHDNYVVYTNLCGLTFAKEFKTEKEAIQYYKEKIKSNIYKV